MCRSIKVLRSPAGPPNQDEVRAAALQFVRKVSGFRQPSRRNSPAFELAVREITDSASRLLGDMARGGQAPQPEKPALDRITRSIEL